MRTIRNTIALYLLLAIAGCAGPYERSEGFTDTAAYSEGALQGSIKTLDGLTCYKYLPSGGACATPGRPIHPARAKLVLDQLSLARTAARTAATMPASGGACLGEPSTPAACLALASSILGEVQRLLATLQRKGV